MCNDETIKTAIKCGIIMAIEAYAISVSLRKIVKLQKENFDLKQTIIKQDLALDMFEVANEALSRELESLEKGDGPV